MRQQCQRSAITVFFTETLRIKELENNSVLSDDGELRDLFHAGVNDISGKRGKNEKI